jgi:hypothetical protein
VFHRIIKKPSNGIGVPQDYKFAHMWFNLAAANGDKEAIEVRDVIAGEMTREDINEAQQMAREWMASH